MQPQIGKAYYRGLDAVRFFAALLVLTFHMGFYSWAGHGTTADMFGHVARFDWLGPYCWFGGVGVQIFFVISGFVIAASAANSTALEFATGRFLRLYPGAWVCATLTLLFGTLVAAHISRAAYFGSLTLWLWGPWVDGAYWTPPIELCFYALILALLATAGFKWVPWIAAALTLASATYNIAALFGRVLISPTAPVIGILQRNHSYALLDHGCFFALGIWIWLLIERKVAWPFVAMLVVSTIGCVAQMDAYFSVTILKEDPFIQGYWTGSLLAPIAVWAVAVAVIFVTARSSKRGTGSKHGWLRVVGLMTYPLYLLHDAIGSGTMRILILRGVTPMLSLLLAASMILVVSFAVCMYAEPGIRRALRSLFALRWFGLGRVPA